VSILPDGLVKDFMGYWIYDLVKIVLLLLLTSFVLNLIRECIGVRRLKRSLGRDDWVGMCAGAALGVVTPVCSCSVAPLYASLLHGGAAHRSAACFLFAAPAVNEFAIVLVFFALGWQWAVVYTCLGLVEALFTGHFASNLGLEPCLCYSPEHGDAFAIKARFGWSACRAAATDAIKLTNRLKWALVVGAGLAALLVNFNLTPRTSESLRSSPASTNSRFANCFATRRECSGSRSDSNPVSTVRAADRNIDRFGDGHDSRIVS